MTSPMQLCCEHAAIQPTKRSRARRKPIPTASEVQTTDYLYRLKKTMWDRMRSRRLR